MYVSHSLIPHSAGRSPARHADASVFRNKQLELAETSSNNNNFPDEWIYEGELLGKGHSSDTISRYRAHRVFTQRSTYSEFIRGNQQSSGMTGAIETYMHNSTLTGTNHPVFENVLDVYA